MSDSKPPANPPSDLPRGMKALTELAMDLRWSWNHCSDELWRRLDPALWARTCHPNAVLQAVSRENLAKALADADFCRLLDHLTQARRAAAAAPGWFQQKYPTAPLTCVAYFCMEFMLSEADKTELDDCRAKRSYCCIIIS